MITEIIIGLSVALGISIFGWIFAYGKTLGKINTTLEMLTTNQKLLWKQVEGLQMIISEHRLLIKELENNPGHNPKVLSYCQETFDLLRTTTSRIEGKVDILIDKYLSSPK